MPPVPPPLCDAFGADEIASLDPQAIRHQQIGESAGGRPLSGFTSGADHLPLVSIVAGAHPDEPAGPIAALELLRRWPAHPLATRVRLAVVPQLDVDGSAAQAAWLQPWSGAAELPRYLAHRLRREPGEDREFAWPGAPWGGTVLPECVAADHFLNAQGPAILHLSLHGMAIASGAWFLLDRLALRCAAAWQALRALAEHYGFGLLDSPRYGDKGFRRAGPGFCTTPSGPAMRRWACAHSGGYGHSPLAQGFGYGSMDAARARARRAGAPPPWCAVSEFPLFQEGAQEAQAQPPGFWRQALGEAALAADPVAACAELQDRHALRAVPFSDQVEAMIAMVSTLIDCRLHTNAQKA